MHGERVEIGAIGFSAIFKKGHEQTCGIIVVTLFTVLLCRELEAVRATVFQVLDVHDERIGDILLRHLNIRDANGISALSIQS